MARLVRHSDRFVYRDLREGDVPLHLDSGEYFSLNTMGCRIWTCEDSTVEVFSRNA